MDTEATLSFASTKTKLKCGASLPTYSAVILRVGNLENIWTASAKNIPQSEIQLTRGKYRMFFAVQGLQGCNEAGFQFGVVASFRKDNTPKNNPTPVGPAPVKPADDDALRRSLGILPLQTRFVRKVHMSQSEGCITEYDRSLQEILDADPILQKGGSDFKAKLKVDALGAASIDVDKNVGGFENPISTFYWSQNEKSETYANFLSLLLSGKTAVFTSDPECFGEAGITPVESSTRFQESEPGSFLTESDNFGFVAGSSTLADLRFEFLYDKSSKSFFSTKAGLKISADELQNLPSPVQFSYFDTKQEIRLSPWYPMNKTDLPNFAHRLEDSVLLERILPRLSRLKIIFQFGTDPKEYKNTIKALDVSRVCLGSLHDKYFFDASASGQSCRTLSSSAH